MGLRHFRADVVCGLAVVCCALMPLSCSHSPTAPAGQVIVYISQNGAGAAPGKTVEIVGTSLKGSTDEQGLAVFALPPGGYVVRAYDLGTAGPSRPFVEQSVDVQPARVTRVRFDDCTMCV